MPVRCTATLRWDYSAAEFGLRKLSCRSSALLELPSTLEKSLSQSSYVVGGHVHDVINATTMWDDASPCWIKNTDNGTKNVAPW